MKKKNRVFTDKQLQAKKEKLEQRHEIIWQQLSEIETLQRKRMDEQEYREFLSEAAETLQLDRDEIDSVYKDKKGKLSEHFDQVRLWSGVQKDASILMGCVCAITGASALALQSVGNDNVWLRSYLVFQALVGPMVAVIASVGGNLIPAIKIRDQKELMLSEIDEHRRVSKQKITL